jgi:uncharacterized membrane protein YqjE
MPPPDSDLSPTVSRLWGSVLEGLHLRIELFSLELGEERRRLTGLALSALIAVFALFMVVLSLNLLLLALFWDTHRVAVAGGSCALYVLLAVAAWIYHVRRSRRQASPFAATAAVLAEDERALRELA